MQNVAYVLNRFIAPFFAGFFLAAFASTRRLFVPAA